MAGIVEERVLQDGTLMFRSVVLQRDIVAAVPPKVVANASTMGTEG